MFSELCINKVEIPGAEWIDLDGLIVVVGPNSSGKTQLLRDINAAACGKARDLIVAKSIDYQKPSPLDDILDSMQERGMMSRTLIENNQEMCKMTISHQHGTNDTSGTHEIRIKELRNQYNQYNKRIETEKYSHLTQDEFLINIGRFACSALFLENRLTLVNQVSNFDYRNQPAQNTLHSLYLNRNAQSEFEMEIISVFNRGVWLDNTRGNILGFLASDKPKIPPAEELIQPEEMQKYRVIENEGDGVRSYAAICVTLLVGDRPLCLIDEPEMCLHPPQAYSIGRFIGKHAKSEGKCTLVATHSSHVLRGILESQPNAKVLRLSRVNANFVSKIVDPDIILEAAGKPRSRSENILDGLLSDGVVLCESENDRIVYESAYRTLEGNQLDLRFVPVGGVGGFPEPLKLYKALGVPVAVIGDIDFLTKTKELRNTLAKMIANNETSDTYRRANEFRDKLRSIGPNLTWKETFDQLTNLTNKEWDWSNGGDEEMRRELKKLAEKISRFQQFKRNGIDSISNEELKKECSSLLNTFRNCGLFLVPNGELESWVPNLMNGKSRERKAIWATLAASKIEENENREGDVWEFVRDVAIYISRQLNSMNNS